MNDPRKPRKCQVILLDERRLEFSIQPKLMACDLLDMVSSQFNLHEKEYFGLAYTDERFFVPNILILREPITVELFFMQAKILVFKDKSSIPWWLGFSPKGIGVYDHNDKIKPRKTTAAATRTLRDVARELTASVMSIPSSLTSDISDSISSEYSHSLSTLDGGENTIASKAAEREMAISLSARKEALMEKLKEKTEELWQLCIQEAGLIGYYPSDTPFVVGKTLPPIRKRVGTAFEFSDLVISGDHEEIEEIDKQQMEVEIQSKITSAAKLREMEDQLTRLKREYLVIDDDEDDEGTLTYNTF
ncbi:hypothetical protein QZH41_005690 [Actinostola sp. cb2023]|nr:hypothetical protein QZH41_005690 [Actinostola sp. cb2023]